MGAFYLMADVLGWRRLFFPLVVIGTNSIAMYVLVHTTVDFFHSALTAHFGTAPFHLFGEALAPLCQGATVLLLLWLILWWMYRRRLFLKV
jgi:predicted acyltransferase